MALISAADHPVPLREVAAAVKGWVDRLGKIWVSAQVIELNRRSGAIHFLTLRDLTEEVSVSVTLSSLVLDAAGPISEGMAVIAQLKPTVWLKSGRLSYECFDLRPTGDGQLLAQIEHLKRLLQAEGLFNPSLKRSLPVLPAGIGLITGEGSAAAHDVVVNVNKRWPLARIKTRYTMMQGALSVPQIIEAVMDLDADPSIDVIVIARGGGSVEDLLPFSDETLVRAVAAANTAVVSAIGHEVDTPILDLVADLRASTPTDAAKRIVPDVSEQMALLNDSRRHLAAVLIGKTRTSSAYLEQLKLRLNLRNPYNQVETGVKQIVSLRLQLKHAATRRIDSEQAQISHTRALVASLGPLQAMARGYAILVNSSDQIITSTEQAEIGSTIMAHVSDGTLTLQVTKKKEHHGNSEDS